MSKVIWKPQPKQIQFMSRPEYEALYGGAAGGGKSDALICEALRQVHIPHYRGLIVKSTYPELEALIDRSQQLYRAAYPKARYNKTDHVWRFPSGAQIFYGYMSRDDERFKFQGKPYDFIAVDELTHHSQVQYEYLKSRNRPNGPGTRVYIRATCNPDGKGMGWVKNRFVTPAPPMTTIREKYPVHFPDGHVEEMERDRIFVPSSVFDNKILLENDPEYLATLASLPEAERNALLYGSWDSFTGQVFTEWVNDPSHYKDRLHTHVIEPFEIPEHWRIYRGFDFGYHHPFSVAWYACDTKGKLYCIKEYYGCKPNRPNVGLEINPYEIAAEIRRIEDEDEMLSGRRIIGIADPSIWDESRGMSIANMMGRSPNFIRWIPGDNHRIAGKMQFHYRLAFDKRGDCMFQVFSTCREFIRTVPMLTYSDRNIEDIDTDLEDHIYDQTRYVFMEHCITPRANEKQKVDPFDPLNQRQKPKSGITYLEL